MDKPSDRLAPGYDVHRTRKVPGVETPPLPIAGVATGNEKRRPPDEGERR